MKERCAASDLWWENLLHRRLIGVCHLLYAGSVHCCGHELVGIEESDAALVAQLSNHVGHNLARLVADNAPAVRGDRGSGRGFMASVKAQVHATVCRNRSSINSARTITNTITNTSTETQKHTHTETQTQTCLGVQT